MGKVFTTDELYAIMRGEQQNQQTAQDARAATNDRANNANSTNLAHKGSKAEEATAVTGSVNEGAGEEKPKGTGIDLSPKQNVTGNALYDQWREAMTGRLGKDFEARMNAAEAATGQQGTSSGGKTKHLFTGEGQRTTDGFTTEQAAQYKELLSRLDGIQAASAFALTVEQSDALEKERAETLSALHQMDADAGRAERAYDARDRAGAFFKSWGKGTAASYTNTAGSMLDLADVAHQASSETQRRIADNPYAGYVTDPLIEANFAAAPVSEETSGFLASQRKERDALYETADKLLTESERQMAKAKQGTSAVAQFALDAAKTGMDIAADTAASAIGVPGLANMAVRVYGSEAQQARLSGDDAQTAAAKGVKAAMIEVLTEKISGPFEKAYGSSLGKAVAATKVGKAVNAAVDKLKSSGLIRLAMGAAGEGFEEGVSDVLNTVADHVAGWDDGTGTIWDDIKGDKEQILYDMLLGAFVGTFGGVGNLARGNANATAEAAPTQQTAAEVQSAAPTQQTAPAASAESRAPTQSTQYPQGTDTQEARPGMLERVRAAREQKKAAEAQATAEFFEAQAQYYEEHGWEAALPKELETKNASKWVKARTAAILEENAARTSREAKATPEAEEQVAKGKTGADYLAEAAGPSKGAEAPQTRTETQGDNPAPAEAENVKQAGSGVLNSALNFNNAETRAEGTIEERRAALDQRLARLMEQIEAEGENPAAQDALTAEAEAIDAEDRAIKAAEEQLRRVKAGEVSKAFGSPENHIDNRSFSDAANKGTKAFQFDYPELHGYFVEAAQSLLADVQAAQDADYLQRYKKGGADYHGPINRLVDSGMTKPRIMQCLNDIISNNGAENYADAKRVEIVLNDMLSNGWLDMSRRSHEANAEYVVAKDGITGAVKADSWEKYRAAHALSLGAGLATEAQLRAEWEATQTKTQQPAQAQKNTASMQETESTAVNDDPAKHTPEENQIIKDYKAAVDPAVVQGIEQARSIQDNNYRNKYTITLSERVGDKVVSLVNDLIGLDISGYKNQIKGNAIAHIDKRHGANGKANSTMANIEDFGRINYVIENADDAKLLTRKDVDADTWKLSAEYRNADNSYAPLIRFEKRVDNTYYVVEAVPDSKANRLAVVSAYMESAKKENPSPKSSDAGKPAPNVTPEAGLEISGSSDTSIPTTAQNVKSENQENAGGDSNPDSKSPRAKTSQTAGTIMEADITSDERAAQLNKYVQNGRFDYIPDTNKRQTYRAVQAIKEKGWQQAAQEFHDSVAAGKSGKDLVARGAVLLNNAGNSDASSQTYLELASDVIELGHKAGETLQAFKILQQLTPEGRLYCMTKTVDKLNRQLSDGQRKAIAKQRLGREYDAKAIKDVVDDYGVKLDQKLVDAYLAAKTDAERDAVISEIQNDIAAQIPSTFEDKLVALRYTAMLGNFKTQGRNVLGNTSSLVTKIVKDRLAATIEGVGYVVSGGKMERTRSVWAGGKLYKEAWADFQAHKAEALGEEKYTNVVQKTSKGIEDARTIFKVNGTWGTENAASEFGRSKAAKFARKGADVGMAALEGWRKATNWTMEAGDAIFARTAYADAMAGWLRAHKVNSFAEATEAQLEKARAFAAKEAQEATFRDSNAFSDAISSFDSGWSSSDNAMLRGMGKVSQGIAPFRKTPANVAVRAFEYSPLGVAESIVKGVQAAKGKATAADVINSISKNATGAAIMWAGYVLSGLGKLRGKEDDKELDAAQKANGAMDYSYITDEGKYISLSQFAPVSIPLFMGARLAELTRDVGIEPKDIVTIVKGTTGVMLDQSMLSGLNDALSGLSNYGSDQDALSQFIENSLLSFVSQHVPTIVRQTEQASEKYRQTTYTDKNDPWLTADMQRWIGKTSAGVPGVDFQQEDYIDMWGRKTEQGSLGKRILDAYFNPVYTSQDKSTPLDKELERLHTENRDKEGFPDVYPDSGSIYTDLDGKGTQMTREEFEQYRIERGTKSRELAQEFFNSDEYGMLSDEQRAEVLRDLYSLAADRALKNVQAAHKISYTGNKDTLAALPDIPQYLAANKLLSDAKSNPTSTNWDSIDKVIDEFSKLSQGAQDVLTDKGLNVPGLRYSHALGMGAEDWYSAHEAVAEGEKTLGGTDAAKAISIYNSMEGKSDEEILNAMRAQLMPKSDDGGKQNATVRRAEAYMTAAKNNGAEGDLGEWLTLTAELKDADENDHVSKDDVEKAWANMGLGAKETYAGITLNDFYNITKSGTKSYANNPDYATQIDKIYAELYPDAPSVKAQLSGSVRTSEKADDGGKTASGVPRNRDAAADWVMKHSRAAKRRIS